MAFGTEHGKVGLWNGTNGKVSNSSQFHRKIVYSIAFLGEEVLSCGGDGTIFRHEASVTAGHALDLGQSHKFSALTTSRDATLLALGFENGAVKIFNPDFSPRDNETGKTNCHFPTYSRFSFRFVTLFSEAYRPFRFTHQVRDGSQVQFFKFSPRFCIEQWVGCCFPCARFRRLSPPCRTLRTRRRSRF